MVPPTAGGRSGPFDFYPVSSSEVSAAAEDTTNRLKAVDSVRSQVEKDHRSLLGSVEGTLRSSAANAVENPVKHAEDINQKALFAAGALQMFATAIDMFDFYRQHPRSVSRLNSAYMRAAANNFGVDDPEYDKDATQEEKSDTFDGWVSHVHRAGKATLHDLKVEYGHLEDRLDSDAKKVAKMLNEGPNAEDLKTMYANGALPSWAALVFPNVDFDDVKIKRLPYNLRDMSKQELIQWMAAHPGIGDNLRKALERLRPKATDTRVQHAEVITISGDLAVSAGAFHVEGKYLVQYLANGQVRFTEIVGGGAGVGAAGGARLDIDLGETEFRSGAMAGAAALGGVQFGRTWQIPPDQIDEMAFSLALEHSLAANAGAHGIATIADLRDSITPDEIPDWVPKIGGTNLPNDEINDFIQHYVDYERPDPVRRELDATAAGNAYAELGLNSGAASGKVSANAKVVEGIYHENDGDYGVHFSASGNIQGDTDTPFTQVAGLADIPEGSLEGSVDLEVTFDENGDPKQITSQVVYGTGSEQKMKTVTVDLDGEQMKQDAKALAEALHAPTPANLEKVRDIDLSSWADDAEITEADLHVGGEDYGAGGAIGIDPYQAGGAVNVNHRSIDYDYTSHAEVHQ